VSSLIVIRAVDVTNWLLQHILRLSRGKCMTGLEELRRGHNRAVYESPQRCVASLRRCRSVESCSADLLGTV